MAELLEPQTKDYVSHLGTFKTQLAIVVFIAIGAHRFFVSALVRSFEVIPVTKFPKFEAGFNQGIEFITVLSGTVFSIGVQLAIPAVLALLLTDLLFGVIGRVIPEANTFILSMPVKMMMGIFAVAVSLQLVVSLYISYFDDSFKAFEFMIEIFGRLFQ